MSKVFQFNVHGSVSIDLDQVVFTHPNGDPVTDEELAAMSTEEINKQLANADLDWDWLQVYRDSYNTNLEVNDVEVIDDVQLEEIITGPAKVS